MHAHAYIYRAGLSVTVYREIRSQLLLKTTKNYDCVYGYTNRCIPYKNYTYKWDSHYTCMGDLISRLRSSPVKTASWPSAAYPPCSTSALKW